jgi:protein SHQ1
MTPEAERKNLREKRELEDFNEEHYLADLMEPEYIEDIETHITYIAEWDKLQKEDVTFTETEVDLLKELPNKEFLLDAVDIKNLCFNLVDILYASCYNHRYILGENTIESGWNINKLSSTLCWFQVYYYLFIYLYIYLYIILFNLLNIFRILLQWMKL